jgi:hypothetical protein
MAKGSAVGAASLRATAAATADEIDRYVADEIAKAYARGHASLSEVRHE